MVIKRLSSEDFINFTLIIGIGILLVLIQILFPWEFRVLFAAHYPNIPAYAYITSAYIHGSVLHLFRNISVYLGSALAAYAICIYIDYRTWFRVLFLVFCSVLPVVVSVCNGFIISGIYNEKSAISYGFSGVAAGFVGLLFIVVLILLYKRYGHQITIYTGILVISINSYIISASYTEINRLVVHMLFVIAVVILVFIMYLEMRRLCKQEVETIQIWAQMSFVFALITLVSSFISMLFPLRAGIANDVNIYAHAVGLISGIIISSIYTAFK